MRKFKLELNDLRIDSFATTPVAREKGTVFGEQCTCYTACTCPGCPTCDASCNGTCASCGASCGGTCVATCDYSCAGSCDASCGGGYTCGITCDQPTRMGAGEPCQLCGPI